VDYRDTKSGVKGGAVGCELVGVVPVETGEITLLGGGGNKVANNVVLGTKIGNLHGSKCVRRGKFTWEKRWDTPVELVELKTEKRGLSAEYPRLVPASQLKRRGRTGRRKKR